MSEDRGPADQRQLEALVCRARTGLRDWTDRTDSDPGVALLDLFAFVGDLLGSHSERTAGESHQQGRVVLDEDVIEEPARVVCGVHRATVLDDADPLELHRLLVQVPDVEGASALPRGEQGGPVQ